MKLIVGLGNPGAQYEGNRHNIGFMAIDRLCAEQGFSSWKSKFQGLIATGILADQKITILKPQTYMNESGRSVGEAARYLKIDPNDITVLYDELDLQPGKLKVKIGGGAGGHNGIRSIDAHIGKDYQRIRLGIGHPGNKDLVSRYVLGDFAKADQEWLDPLLDAIAGAAPLLIGKGPSEFMNKVALRGSPQTSKPQKGQHTGTKRSAPAEPERKTPEKSKPQPDQADRSGPMANALRALFQSKKDK